MQAILFTSFAEAQPGSAAEINLLIAWCWILLGFCSGTALGSGFHKDNWLGGFASLKRRLYRLAHISFFGLGAVNFMFWLTRRGIVMSDPIAAWASTGFVVGAVTMPLACVLMAHRPKSRPLFAIPVISLIAGAGLTLWTILQTIKEAP